MFFSTAVPASAGVLREKSFQRKNVVVRIPSVKTQYQCQTVKQDKTRGTWTVEFNLPEGFNFLDDDDAGSSVDPPNYLSPENPNPHLTPDLDDKSDEVVIIEVATSDMKQDDTQEEDEKFEDAEDSFSVDVGTDSDSTLKASFPDSTSSTPASSIASTPSSTNRRSTVQQSNVGSSLTVQNQPQPKDRSSSSDFLNPQSSAPLQKSPSPVGSLQSHSSTDQYNTPPVSPVKAGSNFLYTQ